MSNFMKIRPVGAELFRGDGQTARHDEANNRFPQFYEGDYKLINVLKRHHSTQKPLALSVTHLVYPKPQM